MEIKDQPFSPDDPTSEEAVKETEISSLQQKTTELLSGLDFIPQSASSDRKISATIEEPPLLETADTDPLLEVEVIPKQWTLDELENAIVKLETEIENREKTLTSSYELLEYLEEDIKEEMQTLEIEIAKIEAEIIDKADEISHSKSETENLDRELIEKEEANLLKSEETDDIRDLNPALQTDAEVNKNTLERIYKEILRLNGKLKDLGEVYDKLTQEKDLETLDEEALRAHLTLQEEIIHNLTILSHRMQKKTKELQSIIETLGKTGAEPSKTEIDFIQATQAHGKTVQKLEWLEHELQTLKTKQSALETEIEQKAGTLKQARIAHQALEDEQTQLAVKLQALRLKKSQF